MTGKGKKSRPSGSMTRKGENSRPSAPTQVTLRQAYAEAVAAYEAGEWQRAERWALAVLGARADHTDTLNLLGAICAKDGRLEEAEGLFARLVELKPDYAEGHCNRGVVLKDLNRLEKALASCDRAIALKPDYAEAHYNRGNALDGLGRLEEALASYDRAISLNPEHAEAHYNRGVVLQTLRRLEGALASYDKAIALKPDYAEAHNNRGNVLKELGSLQQAIGGQDRPIPLQLHHVEARPNLGAVLQGFDWLHEALASYERAIAVKPYDADAYCNRGVLLQDLMRLDEALASFEHAIALDPGKADAFWNMSLALLTAGRLREGWPLHEWRWKRPDAKPPRPSSRPLWLGEAPLSGRRILLWGEQGLGDQIQFCRYASRVAERGGRVILEVHPALVSLLQGLEGVERVVPRDRPVPDAEFDCHCPLMSLPLALGTTLESIPSAPSYLRVPDKGAGHWTQLGEADRPRVGLVWSGSTIHKNDRNRSVALSRLTELLGVPVEWVSLQKEVREGDVGVLESLPWVRRMGERAEDFTDTAAVCGQCELVISVDTSVAHLAGALGRPVWVLLPHAPDWRWLLGRQDSPWYPTMRLYRQGRPGDWEGVLERVAEDLQGWMAGWGGPGGRRG